MDGAFLLASCVRCERQAARGTTLGDLIALDLSRPGAWEYRECATARIYKSVTRGATRCEELEGAWNKNNAAAAALPRLSARERAG